MLQINYVLIYCQHEPALLAKGFNNLITVHVLHFFNNKLFVVYMWYDLSILYGNNTYQDHLVTIGNTLCILYEIIYIDSEQ